MTAAARERAEFMALQRRKANAAYESSADRARMREEIMHGSASREGHVNPEIRLKGTFKPHVCIDNGVRTACGWKFPKMRCSQHPASDWDPEN